MRHPISRVRSFQVVGQYVLQVKFDDNSEQVIDFEPVLELPMFRPLRDPSVFRLVRLDPEVKTLVWPNGADFDPETLHDWQRYLPALRDRAAELASVRAG